MVSHFKRRILAHTPFQWEDQLSNGGVVTVHNKSISISVQAETSWLIEECILSSSINKFTLPLSTSNDTHSPIQADSLNAVSIRVCNQEISIWKLCNSK